MLNYAGDAGKAGNVYTATFWRRRQPLCPAVMSVAKSLTADRQQKLLKAFLTYQ